LSVVRTRFLSVVIISLPLYRYIQKMYTSKQATLTQHS
jgi:hypothetical protein